MDCQRLRAKALGLQKVCRRAARRKPLSRQAIQGALFLDLKKGACAHPESLSSKSRILTLMEREGKKRNAVVLRVRDKLRANPFKSLVFTMLSARTKDEATFRVCGKLFATADTPKAIAEMDRKMLEKILRGVGFYKVKAKHLQELCRKLISIYGGNVPEDFDSLVSLPGVGRKTANVMLAQVFGKDAIAVDVHVHRISNRLGWVKTKTPEQTERALKKCIPRKDWVRCNIAMVSFGQALCFPRNPKCRECPVNECCKKIGVPKKCYS